MPNTERPPTLDPIAVERWQRNAPASSPWLHEEIARRMLDRLEWIKLKPQNWLHWGAVRGGLAAQALLADRYPKAGSFVVETQAHRQAQAHAELAKPWWKKALDTAKGAASPRILMPEPASVDMLWANMALHEATDPQALLARWHQLLRVDGFLMFSCLGPDTAREVRDLYEALGWPPAGHELTDMHDWGDMLVQAGFAEPVMDMERITLTYETPERLLQELRELGRNFHPRRFEGLRGRAWKADLESLLRKHLSTQPEGRLGLTFEVIYGHALKPVPKVKVSALSAISVQDMRIILQEKKDKT